MEVAPARLNRWYYDWIDVATPAAGAAASVTVDGAWYLRVLAARLLITTDSNAANRLISLDYINGRGITYVRNSGGVVIPASQSSQAFEWNYQRTVGEWATNTPFFFPCLDMWLPPGFSVKFAVDNIQVGDQISGLRLSVMKYPSGVEGGPENAFAQLPGV